jgi:hypothetical protein
VEKAAAEKAAAEKAAQEKAAQEKAAAEKAAAEKAAAEKAAAEKAAEEKAAAEKAAQEKAAQEKAAAEKAAAEKAAQEKAAVEKAAAEKAAAEKAAQEKAAQEKAAQEKAAQEKAAAEKAAADEVARIAVEKAEQERLRLVKEKAAARISAFVANKRAQQQEIDDTWHDSKSDNIKVDANEALVETLATQAQITENLKQIRIGLDSIIKRNRLIHDEFQPDINKITSSYNNLNTIIKNNQSSDIITNLGADNILNKLSKLFLALTQKRNANGVPTYSISQKTDINEQSKQIVVDIDNILRHLSNDDSNAYPILTNRRKPDDVRNELVKLRAAKPGSDEIEDIEIFTNQIGDAVLPVKEDAKPSKPVFKPRSALNITNLPQPPLNTAPLVNPPLPPTKPVTQPLVTAKPVTPQALTPRTKPATSNVFDRLSQSETVASHIWASEEQKRRKNIEAKHWADINARPHGGKLTKKKSRKSSRARRHTKRVMHRHSKTRNKRTKRGRNSTHKK